jgi:hypothetical protein
MAGGNDSACPFSDSSVRVVLLGELAAHSDGVYIMSRENNMLHDLIASIKTAVREWKRLRWQRARRASIHTPF